MRSYFSELKFNKFYTAFTIHQDCLYFTVNLDSTFKAKLEISFNNKVSLFTIIIRI